MSNTLMLGHIRRQILLFTMLSLMVGCTLTRTTGRIVVAADKKPEWGVVRMRCAMGIFHGESTVADQAQQTNAAGKFALLVATPSSKCRLAAYHPLHIADQRTLAKGFSHVGDIELRSWQDYLQEQTQSAHVSDSAARPNPPHQLLNAHLLNIRMWSEQVKNPSQDDVNLIIRSVHNIYLTLMARGFLGHVEGTRTRYFRTRIAKLEVHLGFSAPYTTLITAVKQGDQRLVQNLLDNGALLDLAQGNSQLFDLAVREGHREVMHTLLNHAEMRSIKGCDLPLQLPLATRQWPMVMELLALGQPGPECENYQHLMSSTAYLIAKGEPAMLQQLLEAGVSANAEYNALSLLGHATQAGRIEMIKPLLAAHADPNFVTNAGESLLQIARREGYLDVERALLHAGAKD